MLICRENQWTGFYMIMASIMKGLSKFDNKYKFWKSLQVYFWLRKEIQMHFKNRFKAYLKCNSSLNTWWMESILETYKFKLFFSVTNFGSKNISKSICEVYFIFRVQKYIWNIYSFISAGENTNKSHIIYGKMT